MSLQKEDVYETEDLPEVDQYVRQEEAYESEGIFFFKLLQKVWGGSWAVMSIQTKQSVVIAYSKALLDFYLRFFTISFGCY